MVSGSVGRWVPSKPSDCEQRNKCKQTALKKIQQSTHTHKRTRELAKNNVMQSTLGQEQPASQQ